VTPEVSEDELVAGARAAAVALDQPGLGQRAQNAGNGSFGEIGFFADQPGSEPLFGQFPEALQDPCGRLGKIPDQVRIVALEQGQLEQGPADAPVPVLERMAGQEPEYKFAPDSQRPWMPAQGGIVPIQLGHLAVGQELAQRTDVAPECLGAPFAGNDQVVEFGFQSATWAANEADFKTQEASTMESVEVADPAFLGRVNEETALTTSRTDRVGLLPSNA
jgi:hypothetical protein